MAGNLFEARAPSFVPRHFSAQDIAPGFREGQAAADEQSVTLHRVLGFVGGLVAGFAFLEGTAQSPSTVTAGWYRVAGVGAALVVVPALPWSAQPSPSLRRDLAVRGAEYNLGFEQGYSSRLKSRRTRSSVVSGLAGIAGGAVGLAVLCYLLRCD